MTKDITSLMKGTLSNLVGTNGIISHIGGLTRVFEYNESEKTQKKFPVTLDYTEEECQNSEILHHLVPDQSKRCIVYFEGGVSQPIQTLQDATRYTCKISLVCWYNAKGYEEAEGLQSRLIGLFSTRCKTASSIASLNYPTKGITVEVLLVTDSDSSIFSKYTYSQDKSQYLGNPFSSFKIDFKVNYTLYESTVCFSPIVAVDIDNC